MLTLYLECAVPGLRVCKVVRPGKWSNRVNALSWLFAIKVKGSIVLATKWRRRREGKGERGRAGLEPSAEDRLAFQSLGPDGMKGSPCSFTCLGRRLHPAPFSASRVLTHSSSQGISPPPFWLVFPYYRHNLPPYPCCTIFQLQRRRVFQDSGENGPGNLQSFCTH